MLVGKGVREVAERQAAHGRSAAAPRAAASQQGMRRQNLALVLGVVAAHAPLSRADVAGRTGLTRAAVSSLVDELRRSGLLDEQDAAPNGRVGRPGRALAVSDRGPAGLGLEVGVGHLAACVVDLRGEVRVSHRTEGDNTGRPAGDVLGELAELAREAEAGAVAAGLRPVGAVLAVPGLLDAVVPGRVAHAPNLGWHDVDVPELWHGPLASALSLENEANLGALAELWSQDTAARDFVHVSAEGGIGAALVIDGELFRGARGWAGELGHVPVRPDGPRCACGARGCLEQYAGEAAVLRTSGLAAAAAATVTAAEPPQAAGTPDTESEFESDAAPQTVAQAEAEARAAARVRNPVGLLVRAARAQEPRVVAALGDAGAALGIALSGAVNLVDPAALVLGGAYAELAPWLLPRMNAELLARVTVRPWQVDALRASDLGRSGPVIGAALLTVRRLLADPTPVLTPPPPA